MKKYYNIILLILALVCVPGVFAWGNQVHYNITMAALNESAPSIIKTIIMNNMDGCLSGIEYPDVSIFYYYGSDGKLGRDYVGTHNYNIVDKMLSIATNDKERAFAYCYKIHLAEDGVSHNYIVPQAIRDYKLPNYVLHPIQELKIEGHYLNPIGYRLMERHSEYDAFYAKASGRDWSKEAAQLNTIMGGGNFYAKAFTPDQGSFMGSAQKIVYTGLAFLVSDKSIIDYYKLSKSEAINVIQGGTSSLDPSGEAALAQADSESNLWTYIISFVVIITLFIVSWKFKWI